MIIGRLQYFGGFFPGPEKIDGFELTQEYADFAVALEVADSPVLANPIDPDSLMKHDWPRELIPIRTQKLIGGDYLLVPEDYSPAAQVNRCLFCQDTKELCAECEMPAKTKWCKCDEPEPVVCPHCLIPEPVVYDAAQLTVTVADIRLMRCRFLLWRDYFYKQLATGRLFPNSRRDAAIHCFWPGGVYVPGPELVAAMYPEAQPKRKRK